jgi:hypothetical protein
MRMMRRNCRMVSVLLAGIELSCPHQRTKLLPQLLTRTSPLNRPCKVAGFASESLAGFNRNSQILARSLTWGYPERVDRPLLWELAD